MTASSDVPQRVYDLAEEYRGTSDPGRRQELKDEAYDALIAARITDITRMVEVVREVFEEAS